MAEIVVGQRLRQLSSELGCEIVRHWQTTEGVEDGWDIWLLQANVGVPSESWLFQLLGLVFLKHSTVEPKADLTLREVKHHANCSLCCR